MITASFELSERGVAGAVANFYKADRAVYSELQRIGREYGEEMRDRTAFYTPVRTGFMQDHVLLRLLNNDTAFEVGWAADDFFNAGLAFYPWFVEEGTIYMPAQRPLGTAAMEVMPEYEAAVRSGVKRAIDSINASAAQ